MHCAILLREMHLEFRPEIRNPEYVYVSSFKTQKYVNSLVFGDYS